MRQPRQRGGVAKALASMTTAIAEVLPADGSVAIRVAGAEASGPVVAEMVGDGINDACALEPPTSVPWRRTTYARRHIT